MHKTVAPPVVLRYTFGVEIVFNNPIHRRGWLFFDEHRQIYKPVIGTVCKPRNAVHFFSGYEVPRPEKTLDCAGRDRKGTRTSDHTEQIDELKSHATDINYDVAKARGEGSAP